MYSTYSSDYQKDATDSRQQQYNGPSSSQPQLSAPYSQHPNPPLQQSYPSAAPTSSSYGNTPSYSLADFSQHKSPTAALHHSTPIQQSVSSQNSSFQIQRQTAPKNNAKATRIQETISQKSADFQRVSAQMPNTSHPSSPLTNPQQQQQSNRQQQYGHDFNTTVVTSSQQQIKNVTISPRNRHEGQNEIFQQHQHQQQQQPVNLPKNGNVWTSDYSANTVGDRQHRSIQVTPFRVPLSNPVDENETTVVSEDQPRRQFNHPSGKPNSSTPLKSADQFGSQMEDQSPPQRIYIHQQSSDESRRVAANGKIYFRQCYDQGSVQQLQQRSVTMHAPHQLVAYNQQFIGSQQQQPYPSVLGTHRIYVNQTMVASQSQQQHQRQQVAESVFPKAVMTGNIKPKATYRDLKKKFKYMIYENEYYQEELRNLQRKLLKLSRDKNFLLDRLQGYEHVSNSSDDSDASIKTVEEEQPKIKKRTTPTVRSGVLNAGRKRSSIVDNCGASYIDCGTSRAMNYYSTTKNSSNSTQNQRYGTKEQRLRQTEDCIREPKNQITNHSNYSKGHRHHFTNSDHQRNIGGQTPKHVINGSDVSTKSSGGNGAARRLSNPANASNKRRHSAVTNSTSTLNSSSTVNGGVADSGKLIKKETPNEKINVAFLSPEREIGKNSLDEYMPAVIVSCAAPSSSSSSFTINNENESRKRKFVKRSEVDSPIYNDSASKNVKSEVADKKEPISTHTAKLLEQPKSPNTYESAEGRPV